MCVSFDLEGTGEGNGCVAPMPSVAVSVSCMLSTQLISAITGCSCGPLQGHKGQIEGSGVPLLGFFFFFPSLHPVNDEVSVRKLHEFIHSNASRRVWYLSIYALPEDQLQLGSAEAKKGKKKLQLYPSRAEAR